MYIASHQSNIVSSTALTEVAADIIEVSVKPMAMPNRFKRQADTEEGTITSSPGWYETESGDVVSAVEYTVSVGGREANPMFVSEPSEGQLNRSPDVETCGCNPVRCYKLYLAVSKVHLFIIVLGAHFSAQNLPV